MKVIVNLDQHSWIIDGTFPVQTAYALAIDASKRSKRISITSAEMAAFAIEVAVDLQLIFSQCGQPQQPKSGSVLLQICL